jgi:hypothetical protein
LNRSVRLLLDHNCSGSQRSSCNDGLTDMLTEREITSVLHRNSGDPASALVSAAVDVGGRDNVTVIVIGWASPGFDARSGGRRRRSLTLVRIKLTTSALRRCVLN